MAPADDDSLSTRETSEGRVVEIHEPIYREHAEPRDGYEPPPMWLWFFVIALMGFGGWYLGQYSAGFDPSVYWDPAGMRTSGGGQAAAPTPVDPMVLGKRVYNNCMACHQADGRGVPGNYPPLDGTDWVNGDPARMAALILHGIEGELVVLGETYNQVMPKWSHLSDEQIAAVMTYVRSSWSNDAGAVEPSLVSAVRAATSDRRSAWRAAELEQFTEGFEEPRMASGDGPEDGRTSSEGGGDAAAGG